LLDIEREQVDGFARAFEGCQAVVFAAGAGPDGKVCEDWVRPESGRGLTPAKV
jgi:hypothetical protein